MTEPSKSGAQSEGQGADGRFQPGNTLGRGRKAGSRNKATLLLDELADGEAEAIFRGVLTAAKEMKPWAVELVLNRVWPARKARAVSIDLPAVNEPADALKAQAAIVQAAASGEIALDEAQALAAIVDQQRRAVETVRLEQRLAKIEEALANK